MKNNANSQLIPQGYKRFNKVDALLNHNDAFIAHLGRFMPQWQSYRDELNQFVL